MNFLESQIEDMIQYKESLGYSRRTYSGFLNDLARYLLQKGIHNEELKLSEIMPWCVQRDTEKPESFRRRITAVLFPLYLYIFSFPSSFPLRITGPPRDRLPDA